MTVWCAWCMAARRNKQRREALLKRQREQEEAGQGNATTKASDVSK